MRGKKKIPSFFFLVFSQGLFPNSCSEDKKKRKANNKKSDRTQTFVLLLGRRGKVAICTDHKFSLLLMGFL
jgi:hypothetical protein